MLAMPCPVCGAQSKRLFVKDDYPIQQCVACRHRFVALSSNHIRPHCTQATAIAATSDQHAITAPGLAEAEVLQSYGWRYAKMFKAYMPPGTILDVSVAAGFMLKGILDYGWHGVGLEANHRLADYGRMQLGLPVMPGSLEETVVNATKQATFDLVMMVQSIDHFQDLHQALHNAALFTRPDGFWFIETWDRTSWPAQLLGRYWHDYKPPTVRHWFSPAGVAQLAEQYGFIEVARGRPQKWLSGAHLKSQIEAKVPSLPASPFLQAALQFIPDQVKVPRPNFDLFWILLQKRAKPRVYSVPFANSAAHPQATAVALR